MVDELEPFFGEVVGREVVVFQILAVERGAETLKAHWLPVLRSSGDEEQFFKLYDTADNESATDFLTFRLENPNSLISCISNARENARQVRDHVRERGLHPSQCRPTSEGFAK